jgi:cardiolipin synthase
LVSRRSAQAAHPRAPQADALGRIWTIPNLISFARLLGVPLFLYLFLGAEAEVAALVVLAVGGTSDWIDGYVARR